MRLCGFLLGLSLWLDLLACLTLAIVPYSVRGFGFY